MNSALHDIYFDSIVTDTMSYIIELVSTIFRNELAEIEGGKVGILAISITMIT